MEMKVVLKSGDTYLIKIESGFSETQKDELYKDLVTKKFYRFKDAKHDVIVNTEDISLVEFLGGTK